MKILLSLFMLLTTLNSCDSSKKAIENSNKMQQTLSGTYYITQLGDTDVSTNKMVITFDDATKSVSGYAACNNFFGTYETENNTITFGTIGSSKKMCQKDIMTFENQFFKSLNSVNSFSIKDSSISFSENDKILINATHKVIDSQKDLALNSTDNTTVTYKASSRNLFDFVIISKSEILIYKDRNIQKANKYKTETEDWETIQQLIDDLDLESIKDLIPPSKKFQFDGAPHASLTIKIEDVEYLVPTFDHGNPPQAIEALVNKVLSVKENTVKQ